jgi:hypothetical protein
MATWPCPECGAKRGHTHNKSCSNAPKPCPECGAQKGRTHKTTCSKAQRTRWRTTKDKDHSCNPVVYKTRGNVQYLRCSRCKKTMGKRQRR